MRVEIRKSVSVSMDIDPDAVLQELKERTANHKTMTREWDAANEQGGTGTEILTMMQKRGEITRNLEIIADLFDLLDGHLTTGKHLPREWRSSKPRLELR